MRFNGSSIEKIVADKCLATLSKARFKRAKDFYDLYIISSNVKDIDYTKVVEHMVESVGIDTVLEYINQFPFSEEIMVSLNIAWDKLILTSPLNGGIINNNYKYINN